MVRRLAFLLLGIVFLLGTDSASAETLRVVARRANVRIQPDAASQVMLTVEAGTVLQAISRTGDWWQVILPSGPDGFTRLGYVAATVVEVISPLQAPPPSELAPRPAPVAPLQSPPLPERVTTMPAVEIESGLTDEEVESAINSARRAPLEPYSLRKRSVGGFLAGKYSGFEFGRIYTPFIRVALAARQAFDRYQSFSVANVTPELRANIVYIEALPYATESTVNLFGGSIYSEATSKSEAYPRYVVIVPGRGGEPMHPLWVKEEATDRQSILPYYEGSVRAGAVAAFPRTSIAEGFEIVLVYANTDKSYDFTRPGVFAAGGISPSDSYGRIVTAEQRFKISREDLKRWR